MEVEVSSTGEPATKEKGYGRTRSKHIWNLASSYRFPTKSPELPSDEDEVESTANSINTCAAIVGMDPLVAAIYKNTVLNYLCRLPDEILLLIMSHLDDVALFCLRHSSRTFLRLFSSPDFQQYHMGYGYAWASQRTWYDGAKPGGMVISDRYCAKCAYMRAQKRNDPRFAALFGQRLHCSPCKKTHPAVLFSAAQRHAGDKSRICIGHEGSLRVCDHLALSWRDIERWVALFGDLDSYGLHTTRGRLCDDTAHKYRCEKKSTYRARPDGLFGGVEVSLVREHATLTVTVEWRNHAGLRGTLSSMDIRQALEATQQEGARHLVPPLRPGDSGAMRAFDPNTCSCVHYSGSEQVAFELYPPREGTCRSDEGGSRSLDFGGCHYTKLWSADDAKRDFSAARCPHRCGDIEFRYSMDVSLNVFGRKDGQVIDPLWYRVLNPESYGLAEDEESRHILWCPRKSCGNYHGNNDINRFSDIKSY